MADSKKAQEMRALYRRAAAARDLAHRGDLDGELALSYVVWPGSAIAKFEADSSGAITGRRSTASAVDHLQRIRDRGR